MTELGQFVEALLTDICHRLTLLGSFFAVSGGMFVWLAEHHTLLSAFCMVAGLLLGVYGAVLQRRRLCIDQLAAAARDEREEELHRARLCQVRKGG